MIYPIGPICYRNDISDICDRNDISYISDRKKVVIERKVIEMIVNH